MADGEELRQLRESKELYSESGGNMKTYMNLSYFLVTIDLLPLSADPGSLGEKCRFADPSLLH
jgi:hypothetical protein